jgi:hypothetical protein
MVTDADEAQRLRSSGVRSWMRENVFTLSLAGIVLFVPTSCWFTLDYLGIGGSDVSLCVLERYDKNGNGKLDNDERKKYEKDVAMGIYEEGR